MNLCPVIKYVVVAKQSSKSEVLQNENNFTRFLSKMNKIGKCLEIEFICHFEIDWVVTDFAFHLTF